MLVVDLLTSLVRREDNRGVELDREYWDRVNQGETVSAVARQWEQQQQQVEPVPLSLPRPGRVKRHSFLETQQETAETFRDQGSAQISPNVWHTKLVEL